MKARPAAARDTQDKRLDVFGVLNNSIIAKDPQSTKRGIPNNYGSDRDKQEALLPKKR